MLSGQAKKRVRLCSTTDLFVYWYLLLKKQKHFLLIPNGFLNIFFGYLMKIL